jgi:hypothetical protein
MDTIGTIIAGVIIAFVIIAIASILGAIPLYFLWNWLMPIIFGLTQITFLQAIGINFLAAVLFKTTVNNGKSKS